MKIEFLGNRIKHFHKFLEVPFSILMMILTDMGILNYLIGQ